MSDLLALFTLALLVPASLAHVLGCDRLKGSRR